MQNLPKDAVMLEKQSIVGGKNIISRQIGYSCYMTKSNSRLFRMPIKLWVYQLGKKHFNEEKIEKEIALIESSFNEKIAQAGENLKKIVHLEAQKEKILTKKRKLLRKGNRLMRWGEPPALYQPTTIKSTVCNILYYLHTEGYFSAMVSSTVKWCGRAVRVTYHVQKNDPYIINGIQFDIPDSQIKNLIINTQRDSLIKKGTIYKQNIFISERERIYNLLCNNGYYECDEQYISFIADTTAGDNMVDIVTRIGLPKSKKQYTVFGMDRIFFVTDSSKKDADVTQEKKVAYNGIIFNATDKPYNLKKLASKIPLRSIPYYNKRLIFDTYTRLYRTRMFESLSIFPQISSNKESLITYIYAKPYEKYKFDTEIALEILSGLPRFVLKPSLTVRRFLGLLDIFKIETHITWGGGTTVRNYTDFYHSMEYGINCSFELPQIAFPFSYERHMLLESFMPVTKFLIDYSLMKQSGYKLTTFIGNINYYWQTKNGSIMYELIPYNLSINYPEIADSKIGSVFRDAAKKLESFQYPSFVSNMSLKTTFKNIPKLEQHMLSFHDHYKWNLTFFVESGGLLQNFFNFKKNFHKDFLYFQYLKFDISYVQHIPLWPRAVFAYQTKLGVAIPYGKSKQLPLDKYYYIRRSNSIRAWELKNIGQGVGTHLDKKKDIQKGELLLQKNIELRQPIAGVVEGALFLDVGNVWMLHHTNASEKWFSKFFFKEFVIGTGIGLRLNFKKVFILCFDLGIKLYDPNKLDGTVGKTYFNLGIGYPF